jgi:hypothetical protein
VEWQRIASSRSLTDQAVIEALVVEHPFLRTQPEPPKPKPSSTGCSSGTHNSKWSEQLATALADVAAVKPALPRSNRDLQTLRRLLRGASGDWHDAYRRRN